MNERKIIWKGGLTELFNMKYVNRKVSNINYIKARYPVATFSWWVIEIYDDKGWTIHTKDEVKVASNKFFDNNKARRARVPCPSCHIIYDNDYKPKHKCKKI